jgi:acetyl-CoA carboxylase carboxyl transferase subunit beta
MVSARDLIASVLDPGSFASWDAPIDISHQPDSYRSTLERAAAKSGVDESVLTGSGQLDGRTVAVIVNEFGFLAGSIGMAAAERIVSAVRRATAEGLPLLASTASGGTRMQEGTPAFVKMADIARALADHKAAGLPYLVHLRHPTTGGVFASWGSLGHLTSAEPAALIGFLGPKVFESLNGYPFPEGVQVSDRLATRGVIDGVLKTEQLRDVATSTLALMLDPPADGVAERRPPRHAEIDAWDAVQATRDPQRPGIRDLVEHASEATVRLSGTGTGERDSTVFMALAQLSGTPCVLVGHDRSAEARVPLGPAGLRQAQRGMRLAEQLKLPLVCVIDTAGADLSEAAELGAVAPEIARSLATLTTLSVPTVSVLLGQGCGGGALALTPAKTVIAAEKAWLSPLPPEGASAILFGNVDQAAEMARNQRVGAGELKAAGIVHHIVPELPDDDAHSFSQAIAAEVAAAIRAQLS